MSLKPQDVCVLLKIVVMDRAPWSYGQLASELGMSASEVHAGVKRASEASLMRLDDSWGYPDVRALEEFLVHGLKYVFPPVRGGLTLGVPTAHAAPPLNQLVALGEEPHRIIHRRWGRRYQLPGGIIRNLDRSCSSITALLECVSLQSLSVQPHRV